MRRYKLPVRFHDGRPYITYHAVAGQCIRCEYPHFVVNDSVSGNATVRLTVLARPDGAVSSVEVVKAPAPAMGAALSQAAALWLFYPVLRNGVPRRPRRASRLIPTTSRSAPARRLVVPISS